MWQRVVAERASGEGWRDIAERAGLSERQCRRIYLAHARSSPTLEHEDVVQEIEDAIAFYNEAISELALISTITPSEVARVAAIKARINARVRKTELLSVAGVQHNARNEIDVRAIASAATRSPGTACPRLRRLAVLAALRADHARGEHHQLPAS